jgi:hypothetical protein
VKVPTVTPRASIRVPLLPGLSLFQWLPSIDLMILRSVRLSSSRDLAGVADMDTEFLWAAKSNETDMARTDV